MKLRLDISGGQVAQPRPRTLTIDTGQLPAPVARAVEDAVARVLAEPQPRLDPARRDARGYELYVEHDGARRAVVAEDGAVSPALRQLMDQIESLATPR